VIVPPVPTPATTVSTSPSVAAQISGPVVSRWIRGLARLVNCWGTKLGSRSAATASASLDGAGHSAVRGRQHQVGAQRPEEFPALLAHRLGHRQDEVVPLGRRGDGQADAGVATGRLDDGRPRVEVPLLLGPFQHRDGDAVLHRPAGVGRLDLP